MPVLLNIQASPRGDRSISRALSEIFIEQWKNNHPDGKVITRNLMETTLPFVDTDWVAGAFIPAAHRTAAMNDVLSISDALITELKAADHILIGTPMYNFNTPAVLKAYIDQIVRYNETFAPGGVGLIKDKVAKIIIASRGYYTPGAKEESMDDESRNLKRILAYIGITDVEVVLCGGSIRVNTGEIKIEEHLAQYKSTIIAAAI